MVAGTTISLHGGREPLLARSSRLEEIASVMSRANQSRGRETRCGYTRTGSGFCFERRLTRMFLDEGNSGRIP